MGAYTTLRNGSSGSDVKKLQQGLMDAGYDVGKSGVDGIYGTATEAAVRKYQQANGLTADGIAGDMTLGKLYGASATPAAAQQGTASPAGQTFTYKDYAQSDTVKQAQAMLEQQLSQKPGSYQSTWNDQLNETIDRILNREDFSYDLNGDALYQQYKDKYLQQGKLAMMDTMGQAQAMTGGYGNSYAQSVGQQAYQAQLQNLNDMVPELYQLALDRYNQEGQDLLNQYSMLGDRENQDYGRYQDQLDRWNAERDYLAGRYDAERDYDYSQYLNDLNTQYQMYRDRTADEQWQKEFDEAKRQYDQQYALSAAKSSGGSYAGSSGGENEEDDTKKIDDDIPENFGELVEFCRQKKAEGYDDGTISQIIQLARQNGVITTNQYKSLKYTFGSDKLTY